MKDCFSTYKEQIDHLLTKRWEVYPARDESFEELSRLLSCFTDEMLSEINQTNEYTKISRPIEIGDYINYPVFICGASKSGTSLLPQLLDNHKDLFVMPGDSHFMNHFANNRWAFHELAHFWIKRFVNPSGKPPFWFLGEKYENYYNFLKNLKKYLEALPYSFQAVVAAANGKKNVQRWMEKTPHNELHADSLKTMFPSAKFMHVIRNPIDNIASLKRLHKIRGRTRNVYTLARMLKKLFRRAMVNQNSIGAESYRIIYFEDLIQNPEQIMKEVANFLNIPFHSLLLTPTENDQPTVINSMYEDRRISGKIVNSNREERWKNELTKKELKEILHVLYDEASALGYADWLKNKAMKKHNIVLSNNKIMHYLEKLKQRI